MVDFLIISTYLNKRKNFIKDEILNRIVSLLLSAVVVFVVLALFGFVLYAGIFIFLGIVLYLLLVAIRDEFFKCKSKRKIRAHKIIEMGEVEIIPPQKTKK